MKFAKDKLAKARKENEAGSELNGEEDRLHY
jgi:hypothetical protein